MRTINTIQDIVDWGLCVGCGACLSACNRSAVTLINFENIGIRPHFETENCKDCVECLSVCPGYRVDSYIFRSRSIHKSKNDILIGPTLSIWEGAATNEEIRFSASSGGLLTAISLYCLEVGGMESVVHTGPHPGKPWMNKTTISKSKNQLLFNAGSRYGASSPCDCLSIIEESSRPCVFIGKPCDTAAVSALRLKRPKLDANLGLVLSFCCAGVPSVRATLDLLQKLNIKKDSIRQLSYRGNGWPGGFSITNQNGDQRKLLSYIDSWHFLQKYRSFRCHLCPDGLGELCDISCGDAWHRYDARTPNPGLSILMVRSELGQDILNRAMASGYVSLTSSTPEKIIEAQGLVERRKEVFGRQLAMRLLMIPTTKFIGFSLFRAWLMTSPIVKGKTILGTLRRLLQRGLWHRNRSHKRDHLKG